MSHYENSLTTADAIKFTTKFGTNKHPAGMNAIIPTIR